MFFNKILSMPITSVSRCRVATNSTSFMASTFFKTNGEPKDAIVVDSIKFDISSRINAIEEKLYYNEEKDVYIIKFVVPFDDKMYYLIFAPELLQETLTMIGAKSTLMDAIFNINKAEYIECRMDGGFILFDQFDSYMKTNTVIKVDNFIVEPYVVEIDGYAKNSDDLYEFKKAKVSSATYFLCIDNLIVNRKLFNYDFICNFLGYTTLEDLRSNVGAYNYVTDENAFYGINTNRTLLNVMFQTEDRVGVVFGNIQGNITPTTSLRNINTNLDNSKTFVIEKARFTPDALETIIGIIANMYSENKSTYACHKGFAEIIRAITENNIFMLFEM